jgi:uncharacterized repeat protein (TIGR01451 family)
MKTKNIWNLLLVVLMLPLVVVTLGSTPSPAWAADFSLTDTPSADLEITVTDGVTTAVPGGSVTYTITAHNVGPSNASGATVVDTFPAALTVTWTCVGVGGDSCTASGSGNINDTVNLPAGGSVTYTVSATISASAMSTLTNTVTVAAPAGVTDPTPENNSATDSDTLTPLADLEITVTDGVTTAVPGGSVTYTITAYNAGPSNASGATVVDTFPAALTVTWTCVGADGGSCTASGSGNINDTVNLPAGGSVTYTASAAISVSATGTLTNTATVTTPTGVTDLTPANNSATDTTSACATTVTVTSNADSGAGSLRQAIAGLCSGGTITFNGDFTITLANQLNIASDMTIDASGHSVTVSGNNTVKIFNINPGVTVNLTNLTIVNGNYFGGWGGGIENYYGTLTVTNCTITGNSAWFGGGIHNDHGTLTVTNSTITGNSASGGGGGGIYTGSGTLTVKNSSISSNSSYSGGGIYNDLGTLNVDNSTISANLATNYGGGISNNIGLLSVTNSTISGNNAANGGGIQNGGTLDITNSTISGNSAPTGGGIYISNGSNTLTNSTLSANSSSGIYNVSGTLNIKNCIIAKGSASGYCCYGGGITGYNNLADDTTCGFTNSASINLGTLGNFGGSTQTIPLMPGSAALDAGDDDTCEQSPVNNLDQRGVSRPMGMHCDIGAYEYRGQVKLLPETIFDSIQAAYDSVSNGTITIEAQTYIIPEELLFDKETNVTLKGGMDESYNPTSGYSPAKKLTVEKGQAVISNIIIKP